MKKFLTILLTIITISVNAQYILYRAGNVYYATGGTFVKIDTTLIRILGIGTAFPGFGTSHSTAAYGDHNHSGLYLPIAGTAANSSLLQGKDSAYIKDNWGFNPVYSSEFHVYSSSDIGGELYLKNGNSVLNQYNESGGFSGLSTIGGGGNKLGWALQSTTEDGVGNTILKGDSVSVWIDNGDTTYHRGGKSIPTFEQMKREILANSGTFNDSILDYNSTRKTFTTYSTKPSGLGLYIASTQPDGTSEMKINGFINPTGYIATNGTRSWRFAIKDPDGMNNPTFTMVENSSHQALHFDPYSGLYTFNDVSGTQSSVGGGIINIMERDSIRSKFGSYYNYIGDYVKNNYLLIDYKGSITQKINNVTKFSVNTEGMIKVGNDTVPVRKPVAADTASLTGRIGDTFIDTSSKYWYNTKNGRGGWVKLNYIIPIIFFIRRKKSKINIS